MRCGSADAPVTVIEYASLACPHCASFQRDVFPRLTKAYVDTGKIRFIFREFPIRLAIRRSAPSPPAARRPKNISPYSSAFLFPRRTTG